MNSFDKVILILSPGMNKDTIKEDLLDKTVYDWGAKKLPENIDDLSHGIYVEVFPNHSRLNDIINLDDTKIIVQTHTIGQISQVSGQLFANDKPEVEITSFTGGQHGYKRLLGGVVASENLSFHETPIGGEEGIKAIWENGNNFLSVEPVVPVVEQPVSVVDSVENNTGKQEDNDNEVQPSQTSTDTSEIKDDEDKVEEVSLVSGNVDQSNEVVVDKNLPSKTNDDMIITGKITTTNDSEISIVNTVTTKVESETSAEQLADLDFEKALVESLALADKNKPKTETDEIKKEDDPVGKVVGIPDTYPNVGQTVTFNKNDLFKPFEGTGDGVLYDFAGTPARFNFYHAHVAEKIDKAMGNPDRVKFTEFEQAILQAGEDRVAGNTHEIQYTADARWSNLIKAGPTNVPIIMPIRDPEYGSNKYFGPETVSLLQNRMKTGCKLGVFLPHTGIYFIIVSPDDSQFIDTLAIINNQRIQTLRASSGILLGNSNFYINRQIMKLFIDSIVHCSLTAWNRETLMKLINERDINIIAQVLGASIYPDGYDYVQVCGLEKTDGKICTAQTRKLVDLRRMIFVDNSRLSEAQRIQAAQALAERSVSDIERYQEANYIGYKKPYEITPGIQFVYRSQSALTSIEAGEKWIKEIEAVVDSIITFNNDEDTRNLMIEERISLTRIREFSHWIEEIIIDDKPMTERDKIDPFLNTLSRNKEVVKKVSDTLTEFQRLSSIAIVAIPRCECHECKATDKKDLDIATHLIPQDAVSRLFTLVRQFKL